MADLITDEKITVNVWHLFAGIIMCFLGLFIWFNPVDSLVALALYLGFVFVVIGTGYIFAAYNFKYGWYLGVGILDIIIGIVLLMNVGITTVTLPIVFALWCLAVGILQIVASWELRKIGWPWKMSVLAGALGVIFGFVLLAYPLFSATLIVFFMGLYAVIYGGVEILEYFYARKISH